MTLSDGVTLAAVSKMLGPTSIKTTQIYVLIVDEKISKDMKWLALKDGEVILHWHL